MLLRNSSGKKRFGTYTVEFALVAPIFFLFLFGVFEYGRMVFIRQIVSSAAREGARYAVVHTADKTTADIVAHVNTSLGGTQNQFTGAVSVNVFKCNPDTGANIGTWSDAAFGEAIAVEVTGAYQPILPVFLFMPNTINMYAIAAMNSEAN